MLIFEIYYEFYEKSNYALTFGYFICIIYLSK